MRIVSQQSLASLTVPELPPLGLPDDAAQTIALIDVLWLSPDQTDVVCGFDVEKSTSIYSGILRLVDLAKSLNRPALPLFLSDLNCHCEGMCRFGEDYRVLLKLARGAATSPSGS